MTEPAELARLIEAYLDGSIELADAARLSALIATSSDDARRIRAAVQAAGLVALAVDATSGEDVSRAVDVRLQAEQDASDVVKTVSEALPARSAGNKAWRQPAISLAVSIAALFLLAVLLHQRARDDAVGTAGPLTAAHYQTPDGVSHPLAAEGRIQLGRGERGILVMAGEPTVFELSGADFCIATAPPGARCVLNSGSMTATVAHQQPGKPLIIDTPHARAVVIGTRFTLESSATSTRLAVLEGAVQLQDLHGASTRVDAGTSASLPEDPSQGESPLPAGALPVAATWIPLFPGAELNGWSGRSGHWSFEDGAVVGWDPAGGWARLVSTRELGDFAMSCRLRIQGMNWAEVQVLDYAWFVPIAPAQPGSWQQVALQVRAGAVTAWCNGRLIEAQPGVMNSHRRFGPLSFYVRTGGRLEIRDARFRESAEPLDGSPLTAPAPVPAPASRTPLP